MERVARTNDMTREDEIEDTLPGATRRREKCTLLQFWSEVKSGGHKFALWIHKQPIDCYLSRVRTNDE